MANNKMNVKKEKEEIDWEEVTKCTWKPKIDPFINRFERKKKKDEGQKKKDEGQKKKPQVDAQKKQVENKETSLKVPGNSELLVELSKLRDLEKKHGKEVFGMDFDRSILARSLVEGQDELIEEVKGAIKEVLDFKESTIKN